MSRYVRRILARSTGAPLRALHHPSERRAPAQSADPFVEAEAAPLPDAPIAASKQDDAPRATAGVNEAPPLPRGETTRATDPIRAIGEEPARPQRPVADHPPRTLRTAAVEEKKTAARPPPASPVETVAPRAAKSPAAPRPRDTGAPPAATSQSGPSTSITRIEKTREGVTIERRVEIERPTPRITETKPPPRPIEPKIASPAPPQRAPEAQITIGRVSVIVEAQRPQQPAPLPKRVRAARPAEDGPAPSGRFGLGQI